MNQTHIDTRKTAAPATAPDAREVLSVYAELTGVQFRVVPDSVLRLAAKFAEHFSFAELEAVIQFMRHQQKNGLCAYNDASFGWRRLMGEFGASDEFQTFQERLGLARDAARRGAWKPTLQFVNNERVKVTAKAKEATPIHAASAGARQLSPEEAAAKLREAMKALD